MNNSTYKLLTQQLHDKDQKMIDQVKELQARAQRIDFLEREVADLKEQLKMETAALHRIRDDINYRKAGHEFLEAMDQYLEAQQNDMLFDPSTEIYKLYEDLCNLYHSVT